MIDPGGSPRLVARALRWQFPGGFSLGPVDLELGPGVWHLPGGNGSGKTTLLRLLAGELSPRSGEVRLNGRDVHRDTTVRAEIGLLRVEPDLPPFLTVEEAWRLMAALRGRPDWDGAEKADVLGIRPGLRLGEGSAGQRRKAELLAAIAGDPRVLLLDEVFATLDAASVAVVAGWIDGWRDRVVVLTSHEGLPVRVDGVVGRSPAT